VKYTHVPYKGGAAASIAIITGDIQIAFNQVSSLAPFIKSGKLRALGVTTLKRSKLLPDVPTINESGVPGYQYNTWTTLGVPAATPGNVVKKLRDAVDAVLARPHTREIFEKVGAEVESNSPEEFTRQLKADYAKWSRISKEIGLRIK